MARLFKGRRTWQARASGAARPSVCWRLDRGECAIGFEQTDQDRRRLRAGPSDIITRIVGAKTGEMLGQRRDREQDRAGSGRRRGGGAFGPMATLLNTATSVAVNERCPRPRIELGKDPRRSRRRPVRQHPVVIPARHKTVAEFVALAKSKPGEIFYRYRERSSPHLNSELFNLEAGLKPCRCTAAARHDQRPDFRSGEGDVLQHRPFNNCEGGQAVRLPPPKRDAAFRSAHHRGSGFPASTCGCGLG